MPLSVEYEILHCKVAFTFWLEVRILGLEVWSEIESRLFTYIEMEVWNGD